ncbi:MAG: GntR family transcriptional regulator [Microbacteriaceae bacterium]
MSVFDSISIRRVSTASQVAEAMTGLILSGKIKAGEHLRENALVTSLGVSRNTVREAMRLLEQGGLVRHEFNYGAVVIEPTIEDLTDLYRARLQLERAAAATVPSAEQLAAVRAAFDALRAEARGGDAREIVAKDLAFHASIVAILGSNRLNAFFAQLMVELQFYLQVLSFEDQEYARPTDLIGEHFAIMDKIESGDPAAAADAVAEHIESNSQRLSAILRARSTSG